MLSSRFHLAGLFAVLLALMAQLGAGATVPRVDPVAVAGALCHTDDDGGTPAHAPNQPVHCPLCPVCATVHVQPVLASGAPLLAVPAVSSVLRPELPPPSTAPPALHRAPSQPRAPPTVS